MTESISIIIGILGLFGTIYSIVIVAKKKKYPGELTLVRENSVGLFNELANSFDEISIEFENAPIDKNIVHIKASIVNNGSIDLDLSRSEQPIKLTLDEGLKWIKTKVLRSSNEVNCTAKIFDDLNIIFECGILRVGEFFQFEALIEVSNFESNSSRIFEKINASHRILNTKKISVTRYLTKYEREDGGFSYKELPIMLGAVIVVFAIFAAVNTYLIDSSEFQYVKGKSTYTASPSDDGTITLENISNDKEHTINLKTFHEKYTPVIPDKESYWEDFKSRWVIMLIFAIGYTAIAFFDFFKLRKSKNVSLMIEE